MKSRLCALAVSLLLAHPSVAQILTGSIAGTVQDPSHAPIPAATVTLTQPATGLQRRVETAALGTFAFNALENGEYVLAVSKTGFKRIEENRLILDAGGQLSTGTLTMELGAVSDTVTVEARSTTVETASGDRADVVTGSQVETLAIRGRNVTSVMQLLPGVVDTGTQDALSQT